MSKFKVRFAFLSVLMLLLITYFVVWLLNTHRQERQRQELESRLAAAVVKKQGSNKDVSIRLADLTNFGWDKSTSSILTHPSLQLTLS